jgi:hypothetical protein
LNALEKHCFVFNIWKMAVEATEIDLYADDLGEEFNQENEYNESGLDLYDDVITPSGNIKREEEDYGLPQDNGTVHHVNANDAGGDVGNAGQPSKKIGIYVGNLSWVRNFHIYFNFHFFFSNSSI